MEFNQYEIQSSNDSTMPIFYVYNVLIIDDYT